MPPGLIVEGDPTTIARAFAQLCALQPVHCGAEGLVCAPRSAPELAAAALAACPLPWRALDMVPGWPDPPAQMVAGWYRRSPAHAPAPGGIRELVQAPGEGFGPAGHSTTAMCLEMLESLPAADALDVGCGSGLLAQAWVALGRGAVLACDLDPRALDQASRSLCAAGRAEAVTLRRGPIAALTAQEIAGRVVLANVPAPAHASLLERTDDRPEALVLSGLRPSEVPAVVDAWRARGLAVRRHEERDGFAAVCMASP